MERAVHVLVELERGDHHHRHRVRHVGSGEQARGLDAVEHRHADVEQAHVGPQAPGELDGLAPVGRLRHDLDAVLCVEYLVTASPEAMAGKSREQQDAYLHDMLESARLIRDYVSGVTFEEFWHNREKRDAVALRISVLVESAHKIDKAEEAALPGVPVKSLRGMRNRIARDYGAVDFKIVWAVTQQEIAPLIRALEDYFQNHTSPDERTP